LSTVIHIQNRAAHQPKATAMNSAICMCKRSHMSSRRQ